VVLIHNLSASEIWPDKMGGLWWVWPDKMGGLWWEWPNKTEITVVYSNILYSLHLHCVKCQIFDYFQWPSWS
jgi:hypothetical protein